MKGKMAENQSANQVRERKPLQQNSNDNSLDSIQVNRQSSHRKQKTRRNAIEQGRDSLSALLAWITELLLLLLDYLKHPIALILTCGLLYLGYLIAQAYVLQTACSVNFLSSTSICKTQIQQPPDIKKIFATQENLAVVQQEVKRFRTLPDKIKTGQLAMRDIEIAISVSDIQGKDEICRHLVDFIELGQTAVIKLLQHQADVNRIADASLGINRWAEISLQTIATIESSPVSRSVNAIISYLPGAPVTRTSIQNIYKYYTKELSEELTTVIVNGQDVIRYMEALERKLVTVSKLLAHRQKTNEDLKNDLDTYWAAIFRLYREELRSVKDQINLVGGMQSDIKAAMASVLQAERKFAEISAEVESLRKALKDPSIRWKNDNVQVESYLSQIRGVIGRLEKASQRVDEIDG